MLIIGQSLECWRPPLAEAVAHRDGGPILRRARRQVEAGACALDLNFGAAGRAGLAEDMVWTAGVLRVELRDVPLFLDGGDLESLQVAVEATPGPVVVNAVPIDDAVAEDAARLLEATVRAGAGVVFSPRTADRSDHDDAILEAAGTAQELVERARARGPVYLDCLTYPPARGLERCRRSLRWIQALRDAGPPEIEPLVAIGNLGHGASPAQHRALQLVYATLAAAFGAGAMMLRAEDPELMSLVSSLEGWSAPGTAFEAWALSVRDSRETSEAPPGVEERAAWELLGP